jgi:hypothetical protein
MSLNPSFSLAADQGFGSVQRTGPSYATGNPETENKAGQIGFHTVAAFAPTSFATLANAGVVHLNRAAGLAADPATTVGAALATTYLLPANASIIRAFVTNNGTTIVDAAGAEDYNIGTNTNLTSSTDIFEAVVPAMINAGGAVVNGGDGVGNGLQFSSVGTGLRAVTVGAVGVTTPSFINVELSGGAGPNTAGDMKVILEYVLTN